LKCKLFWDSYGGTDNHFIPAGTVIDHPDCWKLVRNGHAEPADDECKQKANMTADDIEAAKAHFHKLAMGRASGMKQHDSPMDGDHAE